MVDKYLLRCTVPYHFSQLIDPVKARKVQAKNGVRFVDKVLSLLRSVSLKNSDFIVPRHPMEKIRVIGWSNNINRMTLLFQIPRQSKRRSKGIRIRLDMGQNNHFSRLDKVLAE